MGLDPSSLPEEFKRCMADRPKHLPILRTMDEAEAERIAIAEGEMHKLFIQWLNLNQLRFIHAPMNKKSQLPVGWPDFTVFNGPRWCWIEFKIEDGIVSKEQAETFSQLVIAKAPGGICFDVAAAIRCAKTELGL